MRFVLPVLAAALAVEARGVTSRISPSGAAPSGCTPNHEARFALAVMPISEKHSKRAVSSTSTTTVTTYTTTTIHPGSTKTVTLEELSTMTPKVTVTSSANNTSYVVPISQLPDGQPQDPMKMTVTGVNTLRSTMTFADPVTMIPDGQAQAPTTAHFRTTVATSYSTWTSVVPVHTAIARAAAGKEEEKFFYIPILSIDFNGIVVGEPEPYNLSDHKVERRTSPQGPELYTCASRKPMLASVKNGQLFDGKNWAGYIASNYQLQFDEGVPQSGALYTAGFSVCDDNKLALGNSTVFYRCLSGDFYNLYDRNWAEQCSPVELALAKVDESC